MTCEDNGVRLTWEVQQLEPFSQVWINRGYGRATTSAEPVDVARAVLAGHLVATPARPGETFRALAYTDTAGPVFVTADHLEDDGWTADDQVRDALPVHLREALR
jgi:hypothetical protein